MPTSTVRNHLTELSSDFVDSVRYFVDGFGPAPGAGHHFALRIHASATTEGLRLGPNGVQVGLNVTSLEIKNVDTGETAEFVFSGLDFNADVGPDPGPVDVAVGNGSWVHFDTVDAVRVEDFAGPVRMPSAEVAGREFSLVVFQNVNVDQEDFLGDLARGDGVDISDATVDVPDLVGVSEKIGEMAMTRISDGSPDHSRDLFAGPNINALIHNQDATNGASDHVVGAGYPGDNEARTAGWVDDPAEQVCYPGDVELSAYPVSVPSDDGGNGYGGDDDGQGG